MGRREAAFRQWAADMQARFDAGLEAEEDRAARRKDSLVVLPPPTARMRSILCFRQSSMPSYTFSVRGFGMMPESS